MAVVTFVSHDGEKHEAPLRGRSVADAGRDQQRDARHRRRLRRRGRVRHLPRGRRSAVVRAGRPLRRRGRGDALDEPRASADLSAVVPDAGVRGVGRLDRPHCPSSKCDDERVGRRDEHSRSNHRQSSVEHPDRAPNPRRTPVRQGPAMADPHERGEDLRREAHPPGGGRGTRRHRRQQPLPLPAGALAVLLRAFAQRGSGPLSAQ